MTTHTVGYFVGSLSTQSINRTPSKALIRVPEGWLRTASCKDGPTAADAVWTTSPSTL